MLGLSQEQLAYLLGISRQQLSMSESEASRALPLRGLQRLMDLWQALPPVPADAPAPWVANDDPTTPPLPVPAPGSLRPTERAKLRLRWKEIRVERNALRDQLDRAQVRLGQARVRQLLLPPLLAALPSADAPSVRAMVLLELLREAARTLETKAAQPALLTLRLAVLAFEAGEIQRLLAAAETEA